MTESLNFKSVSLTPEVITSRFAARSISAWRNWTKVRSLSGVDVVDLIDAKDKRLVAEDRELGQRQKNLGDLLLVPKHDPSRLRALNPRERAMSASISSPESQAIASSAKCRLEGFAAFSGRACRRN